MSQDADELALPDRRVDVLHSDERPRQRVEDLGEARNLEWRDHATCCFVAGFRSRVSDETTCARTCAAWSSWTSSLAVRGRRSSTRTGCPRGCPLFVMGTTRSDSNSASSTLFVIINVVTGR